MWFLTAVKRGVVWGVVGGVLAVASVVVCCTCLFARAVLYDMKLAMSWQFASYESSRLYLNDFAMMCILWLVSGLWHLNTCIKLSMSVMGLLFTRYNYSMCSGYCQVVVWVVARLCRGWLGCAL